MSAHLSQIPEPPTLTVCPTGGHGTTDRLGSEPCRTLERTLGLGGGQSGHWGHLAWGSQPLPRLPQQAFHAAGAHIVMTLQALQGKGQFVNALVSPYLFRKD